MRLIRLLSHISAVLAAWDAAYIRNHSLGYIQTDNGSLYSLAVGNSSQSAGQVEQSFKSISQAPSVNASLVVDQAGQLIAVWGDQCGSSPIQISRYDAGNNNWKSVASSSANWYQDEAAVWFDRPDNSIYIYGGSCSGNVANTFYRYNVTSSEFTSLHPSLMPLEMASARAIPVTSDETVVIGGRASKAWMSMQQVAIWSHGSWTFQSVANSAGIDSRDSPLLLPLWQPDYSALAESEAILTGVLVLGGNVNGRPSKPEAVVLSLNQTSGWTWQNTTLSSDNGVDATLYETYVNFESSTGQVSLFDGLQQFSPVKTVSVPASPTTSAAAAAKSTVASTSGHSGVSTAVIAVMSTIFPIIAIAVVGLAGWWWWRKRVEKRTFHQPIKNLGHLRRISSPAPAMSNSIDRPLHGLDHPPPVPHSVRYNRNQTAEVDSIFNMNRNDVQFFMPQDRQELRVVNPDAADLISIGSWHSRRTTSTLSGGDPFKDPTDTPPQGPPEESSEDTADEFDFGRGHSRTTSVNGVSERSLTSRRRVTP